MIKIVRSAKPNILKKRSLEWTRTLLKAKSVKERENAESKYAHREIKKLLVAMFHGKCAYCESKVTHVSYGDIEHYKTKSKFPELTFEWENLLLACGICNGAEYKGNHFPEAADNGPIVNPCIDEPMEHFEFVYDNTAQLATVIGKSPRGVITEQLIGLNRSELRAYRSSHVKKLYVLSRLARSNTEAQSMLEEAKQANAEYAAFARLF